MKALITGTKRPIEPKGIDVYMVDNCARILLTSNADAMVPAEPGERRYFVLDVLDTHAKDTAYFGAMEDELKADNDAGYGRLLWELQHTDLTGFDFRNAPNTDALADQKQHNLPAVAQWLLNRLIDARWWRWTEDEDPLAYLDHSPTFDGPPAKVKDRAPIISKDVAMEDYLAFCRATNHRTHIDEGQFAKKLKEYAGLVSTRRRAPCTIRWGDKLICRKGEREYCFKLPELEEARELFLKKFDLNSMIFNEARAEDAMIAAQDEAAKDKVKAEAAKAGAAKPKTT
jgi:hypothetical protein